MKSLLTLLVIILLASCNTSSDVKFKAKQLNYSYTIGYYEATDISIVYVDSAYRAGDTVYTDNYTRFILKERVK